MLDKNKYIPLWKKYLSVVKILIKKSHIKPQIFQLNKIDFITAGDRKTSGYTFILEIKNARLNNSIDGSAVARELFKSLNEDKILREYLLDKQVKFQLDSNFNFKISTIN